MNLSTKAAVLLLAMSKETAGKMLSHFSPDNIRALILASEESLNISDDELNAFIDEFETECQTNTGLELSSNAIQSMVEETLSPEEITALAEGPKAAQIALKKQSIWQLLERVEDSELIKYLIAENTQVAGYILTQLPSKTTAKIIESLKNDNRREIVAAMITTRKANPEAAQILENIVTEEFSRLIGCAEEKGSQHLVAGVLNELDPELSDSLFTELADIVEAKNLNSVKTLMFRFGDIITLDDQARSTLLDQVPIETLTLALRDSSPELMDKILSSLGQRTSRMLESELKTPTNAQPEEIKKAQKEIASTVLQLASSGSLKIPAPALAA